MIRSARSLSFFLGAIAAGVLWLAPAPAFASSDYPEALQDELDMNCAPPCTVCHRSNEGGYGTVWVDEGGPPFGQALVEISDLFAGDVDALPAALAAVESAGTDSDGDGMGDVEELRETRDPNVPGEGELCLVRYGCGASVAPSGVGGVPASGLVILLSLFGAAVVAVARSRRRA